MTKPIQQKLFHKIIPPCRHCGGTGEWIRFKSKYSLSVINEPLFKLACTKCTFETHGMVETCRDKTLEEWINGVPIMIYDRDIQRTQNKEEYYKMWADNLGREKRPQSRYLATLYCLPKKITRS